MQLKEINKGFSNFKTEITFRTDMRFNLPKFPITMRMNDDYTLISLKPNKK